MLYDTAKIWQNAPSKRVMLFGMSGLGKTWASALLRNAGWFHYSVDYRIGTHYMGEHIVDNFKAEAMKNPFLAELLKSDSIYIGSNITFENLSPLSTYLGKPGNPTAGGIPFDDYVTRQRQHAAAETAAMGDVPHFIDRAGRIYGYDNFVCDTSGSLVELVDATAEHDPIMDRLAEHLLPVWIEGTDAQVEELCARFAAAPKPMYYREPFLRTLWDDYRAAQGGLSPDAVDPDAFVAWGFRRLIEDRLPRYRAMANRWGVTVASGDVAALRCADDFASLIAGALAQAATPPK
ncbi:MAG: ATPase [Pseudomonadota bacterium]